MIKANGTIHTLLRKQLKKYCNIDSTSCPKDLERFIHAVNSTYWDTDEERLLIERSIKDNSKEILNKNQEIEAIFDAFPDIFFRIDYTGQILYFKLDKRNDLNLDSENLLGSTIQDLKDKDFANKITNALKKLKETQNLVRIEYNLSDNGSQSHFEARLKPLINDEIIVIIRNITSEVQTLLALQDSEERYSLAVKGSNDGLWDWNLTKQSVYFSDRWKSMLGYTPEEINPDPYEWFSRVHPEDVNYVTRVFGSQNDNLSTNFDLEYRIQQKDKSYINVLTRAFIVRDHNGEIVRMTGSQTDITQRKVAEEQLRYDALHDKLTGLPNRALFFDRLNSLIKRARRSPESKFAVLFIDLDRFKLINDTLGHHAGDELLIEMSQRIHNTLRGSDTVARLGGDEFVVLLDEIKDITQVIHSTERIQKIISEPMQIEDKNVYTTASIGITLNKNIEQTAEDILRDADTAMYRAKTHGKARHEVFDKKMHTLAITRLNLEVDLRNAIENKEFIINYQPILSLETGIIVRMEALVRWNHPTRGLIPPLEFIPLAEETGLIVPLGENILNMVCEQCSEWQKLGYTNINMAINISARQFEDKNLINMIRSTIERTQINPKLLEVEITETVAMKDLDNNIEIMKKLKDLGVRIAIDDFGIGYSSLNCLKLFPLDCLKIDRAFIKEVPENADNNVIIRAITALAHSMSLKVTAEGVETENQLEFLKQSGCDEAQGFLFSKPLPADEALEILKQKSFLI